jgi:hypothetical protein
MTSKRWTLLSGTILAAVAVGIAMNLKSIRRYIRMSTM